MNSESEFGIFFAYAAFTITGILVIGLILLSVFDIKWHWVRKRTKYDNFLDLFLFNQMKFVLIVFAIVFVLLFGTMAVYLAVTL
jgi:hypothetical protein